MPQASVKRIINCKKQELIKLVLDIEKYPEFVPFCQNAKIYSNETNANINNIVADLTIGKGPFIDTYKSDVNYELKNDLIKVKNIDGPLKYLFNTWHFKEYNNLTEIKFKIDFEIENKFLNILMSKSFKFGLEKIADAFQKRAEEIN